MLFGLISNDAAAALATLSRSLDAAGLGPSGAPVSGRRLAAVVCAAGLALVLAVAVSARDGAAVGPLTVEVPVTPDVDERIALDAALYHPSETSADAPAPAVLLAHGFLGDRTATDELARDLAGDGLAVLTWSARGFGGSEGQVALADPDREIADVAALIDLLADRDDIVSDGPGDPRVAIAGASYGGGTALLSAAADPRIDAVVAAAAWHSLTDSLAPNGAVGAESGPLATGWTSALFTANSQTSALRDDGGGAAEAPTGAESGGSSAPGPGGADEAGPPAGLGDAAGDPCGRFAVEVCAAYVDAATAGVLTSGAADVLSRADLGERVAAISAPTLLIQGQQDTLFGLAESRRTAEGLAEAGTPVRLRWVPGGHGTVGSLPVSGVVRDELGSWLDRWLRPGDAAGADAGAETEAEPIVPFTWTDEAAGLARDRDELPGETAGPWTLTASADCETGQCPVSGDGLGPANAGVTLRLTDLACPAPDLSVWRSLVRPGRVLA